MDLMKKYPDRVPVIVERKKNSTAPDIDKHKYMVPKSLTMAQFMCMLRTRIKLTSDKAIFVFIDNTLVPNSELMGTLHSRYAHTDKMLYVTYTSESTFGSSSISHTALGRVETGVFLGFFGLSSVSHPFWRCHRTRSQNVRIVSRLD